MTASNTRAQLFNKYLTWFPARFVIVYVGIEPVSLKDYRDRRLKIVAGCTNNLFKPLPQSVTKMRNG